MKKNVWQQSSLWLAAVFLVILFSSCTGGGGSGVSSTYVVSGRVVEGGQFGSEGSEAASGIAQVTIVMGGETTGQTVTDEDGQWSFSGVRGPVVVEPILEGYVFDPAQLTLTASEPQAAFVAVPEAESFSITYEGNGSTGGQAPEDTRKYIVGSTLQVLDNTGNLVKLDHVFSGWNSSADGSGTIYLPGNTLTMPSRNVQLYAQWTSVDAPAPVTVTLTMARDGQGTVYPAPGTHTHTEDAQVSIKATAAAGWSFSHWVGNASDPKAASTEVVMDKDQKLTAVFTADTVETASIHGKVVLDGWSVGLIGAVVTDKASGRSAVTDGKGDFSLDGLQAGSQELYVDAFFNDHPFKVALDPGQNNSLTLRVPMDQITWAYFDELVQQMSSSPDGTRRWPLGRDLKVYFEVNKVPAGFQSGQVDTSWDAIQQWTSTMGDRLNAHRVSSSQGADVTVNWVPKGSLPGSAVGVCRYSWNSDFHIVKAEITLDVSFSGSWLKALMIHEFAHSLKLGHSPDQGDIMYYALQNGVVNPSARELEAARLLYSLPTKIRLAPELQAASLQELQVEGGAGTHTEYIYFDGDLQQ